MRITHGVWALTLSGAAAFASCAQAADKMADWIRRPTPEQIYFVYPREAMQRGIGGTATISCIVTVQGGLRGCHVESEKPEGAGFGAAAMALTPQFLLRPATHDGVAVESEINIPIRFEWDGRTASTFIQGANTTRAAGLARVYPGPLPWTRAPTVAELVAAYPEKARAEKAAGHVSLDCQFTKTGGLADCAVLGEEPAGLGFRHAALSLAGKFQGPTLDAEGHAMAGGHTQLAFVFPTDALEPQGPKIGKPRWTALPKPADLAAAMPAQAKAAGVLQASVMLQCVVAADGALSACRVESEAPGDLGYGRAALALSPLFHVSLWTEEGLPTVGGQLRLPMRFDYTAASPPAKP